MLTTRVSQLRLTLRGTVAATLLTGFMIALAPTPASAASVVEVHVTSSADSGAGTLRAALGGLAGAYPGTSLPLTYRVIIDAGVDPVLSSDLVATSPSTSSDVLLEIVGAGRGETTIESSANGQFTTSGTFEQVNLSDLTVKNFSNLEVQATDSLGLTRTGGLGSKLTLTSPVAPGAPVRANVTDSVFTDSALVLHASGTDLRRDLNVSLSNVDMSGDTPGDLPLVSTSATARNSATALTVTGSRFHDSPDAAIMLDSVSGLDVSGSTFTKLGSAAETVNGGAIQVETLLDLDGREALPIKITGSQFTDNFTSAMVDVTALSEGDADLSLEYRDNLVTRNTMWSALSVRASTAVRSLSATYERNEAVDNDLENSGWGVVHFEQFENRSDGPSKVVMRDSYFAKNITSYFGNMVFHNFSIMRPSTLLVDRVTVDASDTQSYQGTALSVTPTACVQTNVVNSTFHTDGPATGLIGGTEMRLEGNGCTGELKVQHSTLTGGNISFVSASGPSNAFDVTNSVIDSGSLPAVVLPYWAEGPTPTAGTGSVMTNGDAASLLPAATVASASALALAPLADNGGSFRFMHTDHVLPTRLPAADSVLIDAGRGPVTPSTDERGMPRVTGARVDVGAVERFGGTLSIARDSRVNEGESATATVTLEGYRGTGLLAGRIDGPVQVKVGTRDGSATAGTDYQSATQVLNFAAPGSRTVTTATTPRVGVQGDRTFDFVLRDAVSALIADDSATVTIQDVTSPTPTPTPTPTTPTDRPTPTDPVDPEPTATEPPTPTPLPSTGTAGWVKLVLGLGVLALVGGLIAVGVALRRRPRR